MSDTTHKSKIINDPVHGFIKIPFKSTFDIVEHPYFQRLRRIKQLGLTDYVYPGACHSRFQHALGASHLMGLAIEVLRTKGHDITSDEAEASTNAILLHDIGHGPFSHALENSIIGNLSHEEISRAFMEFLNEEFDGRLEPAIRIFRDLYEKKFLHQLVTGQLDVDRLDYLKRDSFYTGVTEGVIGSDRIIKMLNVVGDQLVVEAKGIYSIEKFLIARRLMYWQVYLHKTVLAAEIMIVKILKRAKELSSKGITVAATPHFEYFLKNNITKEEFRGGAQPALLERFAALDDNDIIASIKSWQTHRDPVLSILCNRLINRELFRIRIGEDPFGSERLAEMKEKAAGKFGIGKKEAQYLVSTGEVSNNTYSYQEEKIKILYRGGEMKDIADASDFLDVGIISKVVKKYYLCYPKDLETGGPG